MKKKITLGFWLPFFILLALWLQVSWSTRHALAYDGAVMHGFPLPFYSFVCGPFAMQSGSNCRSQFDLANLILDVSLLFGIPVLMNTAVLRWRSRSPRKRS